MLVEEKLFYHLNITYDSWSPGHSSSLFSSLFNLSPSLQDLSEDHERIQIIYETYLQNTQECSKRINKAYKLFVTSTWEEIQARKH